MAKRKKRPAELPEYGTQEVLVNGARTFIVQVRLRDFYAVELALQHITHHNFYPSTLM